MRVWMCDRCQAINSGGDSEALPDGWESRIMPVRGSEGARSSAARTLCTSCDDLLYKWMTSVEPYRKVGLAAENA